MGSAAYQNPTIIINNDVGNVRDSYNMVVSDEERRILEWLSPLTPRERHRAVREGRVAGVGDWLLRTNEFKKWHTSTSQAVHPVLFCYGDPGVGKTYLSSLVIDTLCDSIDKDDVTVACMYCDFHAHREESATGVLAALLQQIVMGTEPIPEEIKEAFKRANRQIGGRALGLPEIHAMLVKSVSSLRRGFICIDALDEFPIKHRPQLWKSLQRIVWECPNTRLFITGRPHIREEVKKYFPGYPDLTPIKPTKEDIREYIAMRLARDPELDAMDAELEADILRIIPDKISGAFLLVSLIMDAVLGDATKYQRRHTLDRMTNGFGLDDAYSTTLSRIREQKGNKAKLGMGTLMWISHSKRPLRAEELCHALAVKVGTTGLNVHNVPSIRTLLSCTLGLVTIDEQAFTVRLVHFTLQEYLMAHLDLFITPHAIMAEICLTYLNFQSVCELSTTLDAIPSTTPFLHYASCNWGFHASKEMAEGVKHLALQHLLRNASHISADIFLREPSVDFLSRWDRCKGRHPDLQGFTGLHCISYIGIAEIAISMVDMERWDMNGRDSNGATPLIWAAKYGNYTLAKLLLEQGDANPTLSDKQGLTPLTHAAKAGRREVVKLFLERGDVTPDLSDEDGRTSLSYAAEFGHEDVMKVLLEPVGVNPNLADKYGRTPLSYAARFGHEGVAKVLLERGDVSPDSSDEGGRTPLSYTAGSRHEGVAKMLLKRADVNPDSSDRYGRTPLSYAAGCRHESVVKILLEREDVSRNSSNNHGRTPLSYAAGSGGEGVVKILLGKPDVDPYSSDIYGRTPLSYAAGSGHEGVVGVFLEQVDVNPDSLDRYSRTPISYAAGSGHEGVVKILLARADVNPDSSDRYGRTPLSHAARAGHEGVVRLLLVREDVNPDWSNTHGRATLLHAAGTGDGSVVKILLERENVNPDSSDEYGRTPLSYAAGSGHEGVVKMLLERADVSPNSPDKYGRTPLSHAAKSRHEGVGILLRRVDIKLGSSGVCGQTPLSLAAGPGFTGLVRLLSEPRPFGHQASPNSDVSQQISVPAVCAPEKVELVLVSRQEGIISDTRHRITEVISLSRSDQSSLNQPQAAPSSSILRPIPTSNTTPGSAATQPLRRLKRNQAAPPPLRRSKRKRLSLS